MPTYLTEGYLQLNGFTFSGTEGAPGSTLSWTGIFENNGNYYLTDDGDGKLDAGTDFWVYSEIKFSGYTVTSGGVEYGVFTDNASYFIPLPTDGVGQTIIPSSGTTNAYQAETGTNVFLCFGEGSLIATPSGERTVETLEIGDTVLTEDGREVPVKWLGRQTLSKFHAGPKMQPVRIRAGALGGGLPHSDLTVTADHGMILDGMVIIASALVNGDTIDFVPLAELPTRYTVYHVETEGHEVILANGSASETFIDGGGRANFDNYQEYLNLYGTERIIPAMSRPRISAPRLVPPAIRARIGAKVSAA